MDERLIASFDQFPPAEVGRASLERLGDTVRGILARIGMTEDELVDALTRDDWSPSEDFSDEEKGTDPSLRSG